MNKFLDYFVGIFTSWMLFKDKYTALWLVTSRMVCPFLSLI